MTEFHGRVAREAAACAREKRISDNGIEPISLWVLLACGVAVLIAGAVLGKGGQLFSYGATFSPGYVRSTPPGLSESGPTPKEALFAYSARGAKIYSSKCQGCHGADAKGNGSTFPSLVGSKWVVGESERFAMVIINGLQGPISDGKSYGVMPPQGIGMTPEDLAGVMTYLRNNMGNAVGDVISTAQAKEALEVVSIGRKKAGTTITAEELNADHIKELSGEKLDPKTMLDPIKLVPAKSL